MNATPERLAVFGVALAILSLFALPTHTGLAWCGIAGGAVTAGIGLLGMGTGGRTS